MVYTERFDCKMQECEESVSKINFVQKNDSKYGKHYTKNQMRTIVNKKVKDLKRHHKCIMV